MRTPPPAVVALTVALLVGLTVALVAAPARAQPFGYYPGRSAAYAYRYEPLLTYGADGSYTAYTYRNGYDGFNSGYTPAAGLDAVLLGATIAPEVLNRAPSDQYGANPNGMFAPDGHQIQCRLIRGYSGQVQSATRRECW